MIGCMRIGLLVHEGLWERSEIRAARTVAMAGANGDSYPLLRSGIEATFLHSR
jgi:hypothetical protein